MSPLPINNDILREWVSEQTPFIKTDDYRLVIKDDGEEKTYIGVYGDGPFSTEEFRAFMESLNFHVVDLDENDSFEGLILVVGEDDWDASVLGDYLDRALERAGLEQAKLYKLDLDELGLDELLDEATEVEEDDDLETEVSLDEYIQLGELAEEFDMGEPEPDEPGFRVRIYSQEMFLFRAMSGIDPFDAPLEVLKEFGRGHPALEYLADLGFDWPECKHFPSKSSGEGLDTEDWRGNSPLTVPPIDYHVGKSGIQDAAIRQDKLTRAFRGELPVVGPPWYMKAWGDPNTSERLEKIAYKLADEIDKAKRRDDRELAIAHWTADLEWLKEELYIGRRFQFQWPYY